MKHSTFEVKALPFALHLFGLHNCVGFSALPDGNAESNHVDRVRQDADQSSRRSSQLGKLTSQEKHTQNFKCPHKLARNVDQQQKSHLISQADVVYYFKYVGLSSARFTHVDCLLFVHILCNENKAHEQNRATKEEGVGSRG